MSCLPFVFAYARPATDPAHTDISAPHDPEHCRY